MNGLRYTLFITDTSLKVLANYLGVSTQSINHWALGRRVVPEQYIPLLEEFFGVRGELLTQNNLKIADKIAIEYCLLERQIETNVL